MPDFPIPSLVVIGMAVAATGLAMLLPPGISRLRWLVIGMTSGGLLLAVSEFDQGQRIDAERALFWLFATLTLTSAVQMLVARNPVHGALWFALTTLGVCMLFVLLQAPFLAAASIIIYAGAIIVTFMFVMMMAQQSGWSHYDIRARTPKAAILVGILVLGVFMITMLQWREQTTPSANATPAVAMDADSPADQSALPPSSMWALAQSLFGDYLFAVELAGTLLLIATVGAIVIAPRRQQGQI